MEAGGGKPSKEPFGVSSQAAAWCVRLVLPWRGDARFPVPLLVLSGLGCWLCLPWM